MKLSRRPVLVSLFSVVLAAGCGSAEPSPSASPSSPSADAGDFCAKLCPSYLACSDGSGAPEETRTPLFVASAPIARTSACARICAANVAALGDSEAPFLRCARCVLDADASATCDRTRTRRVGEVACSASCDVAASRAYAAFERAFAPAILDSDANVYVPGVVDIPAADPRFEHGSGVAVAGGGWASSAEGDGQMLYGAPVNLAPGEYVVGVRLSLTLGRPSRSTVAKLVVTADGVEVGEVELLGAHAAEPELALEVRLAKISRVGVRFELQGDARGAVSSVFFERR